MSWTYTNLESLCIEGGIQTGPFGSQLHAHEYAATGVPVVMPQDLGENIIETHRIARVPDTVAARLTRHRLEPGDIVYSRRGDVTKRALVRSEQEGWICGTGCLRARVDPQKADPQFVSYLLGSPAVRDWIQGHAVGATMPNLNTSILSAVPLHVPPHGTQIQIGNLLGALDDKIAANGAVAEKAETALRLRFQQLQLSTEAVERSLDTWVLFNPPTSLATGARHTFVTMSDLPIGASSIRSWASRDTDSGTRFRNGDTLFARITPSLENGKVGFVNFLDEGETALGSTEFIVMRSRPEYSPALSYFVATDSVFREHAQRHMFGTSGRQRVNASDLSGFRMSLPSGQDMLGFGHVATTTFDYLKSLRDQDRHLTVLRDSLLPPLLTRRLKVKEVKRAIEDAL